MALIEAASYLLFRSETRATLYEVAVKGRLFRRGIGCWAGGWIGEKGGGDAVAWYG